MKVSCYHYGRSWEKRKGKGEEGQDMGGAKEELDSQG